MSKSKFQVVVGNIGTVYDGNNFMQAQSKYSSYVKLAKAPHGRASGENVTFFHNDEIRAEYIGRLAKEEGSND